MKIDKLRAAHAATTQGEWELMPPGTDECGEDKAFDYVRVAEARFITAEGTSATEAGDNSAFIALAHNEFPAMLDEIERLRAEVEAHSDRAQSLMGSEAKRFDEISRLRDANEGAYALLCEFADTINNSLEGDHPNKDEVLQWITQHEDDRDD